MIKYPNGTKYIKSINKTVNKNKNILSSANRGMSLENDINLTVDYYSQNNMALISKRPTPIKIIKVDYSKGIIKEACFQKQSTTDYNGIYKSRYIDFEAKNTKSKTSFPLSNVCFHQFEHLRKVLVQGGIAFFVIQFESLGLIYLFDAKDMLDFCDKKERKSIPIEHIKNKGIEIKRGLFPPLNLLEAIEEKYFK